VKAKELCRQEILSSRALLPEAARNAAGAALATALRDVLRAANRVAGYAAFRTEPPTADALALCREVLLPVLLPDRDLDWEASDGTLLGPDAIATCDVVLVPALAVDHSGNRLGRGGGSYDRALRRARGLTIAVLYDDELVDALPVEPHDVVVGAVVMPSSGLTHLPL
jgi:5-formyltetrahydrofolate cyclo-ligase